VSWLFAEFFRILLEAISAKVKQQFVAKDKAKLPTKAAAANPKAAKKPTAA
jgi:hypothetical protein